MEDNMQKRGEFKQHLALKGFVKSHLQIKLLYFKHLPHPLSQQVIYGFLNRYKTAPARVLLREYVEFLGLEKRFKIPKIAGKPRKKRLEYLTFEEIQKLLERINEWRFRLLIKIMFQSGLRVTEALNLKPSSLNRNNNSLLGKGKGNKDFEVFITENTMGELDKYINSNKIAYDAYIFQSSVVPNQPISRQYVWRKIREYGVEILNKPIWNHVFRHSFASYLRKQGMDLKTLQELMRHSRLDTTGRYAHIDKKELKEKYLEFMEKKER